MQQVRPKETIVYGGAFNPPTLAHVAILKACFEHAAKVQADVWVMPSGDRLDKTIEAPRSRRLEYIDALINDADDAGFGAEVHNLELDRKVSVETIDTLRELEATYPDRTFTFVFGADSTETMAEWKGGDELLERLSMLVIERYGSTVNPLAKNVTRLSVKTPAVSSTQVRERMQTGAPVIDLVSPSVAQLIA